MDLIFAAGAAVSLDLHTNQDLVRGALIGPVVASATLVLLIWKNKELKMRGWFFAALVLGLTVIAAAPGLLAIGASA